MGQLRQIDRYAEAVNKCLVCGALDACLVLLVAMNDYERAMALAPAVSMDTYRDVARQRLTYMKSEDSKRPSKTGDVDIDDELLLTIASGDLNTVRMF